MTAHAKLSASGSKKWLACTPSVRMEEPFPDERSTYADEGTFAHAVFEQELLSFLGRSVDPLPPELTEYDSPELREHVMDALGVVIETLKSVYAICKDPQIMVEQRLDFSPWVPEGFGTGDVVIVGDGALHVMDLKYGKGVVVDAIDNSQMRLYALGAYNELNHLYDIKTVQMTVLQPRLHNYDFEVLSVEELLSWGKNYVAPRAKLAWKGEGPLVPGEHCSSGFCRARFSCAARAQSALAVAKQEFALRDPEHLTIEQIVAVLGKADEAIAWLNDVKAHALKQAERGEEIPGFKLVEGRSNRKYASPDEVASKLKEAGYADAVIYERSLLGITAMEKAIGKKRFAELLNDLVVKPAGKPTLVPVDDKRPALCSVASAAADFQAHQ